MCTRSGRGSLLETSVVAIETKEKGNQKLESETRELNWTVLSHCIVLRIQNTQIPINNFIIDSNIFIVSFS